MSNNSHYISLEGNEMEEGEEVDERDVDGDVDEHGAVDDYDNDDNDNDDDDNDDGDDGYIVSADGLAAMVNGSTSRGGRAGNGTNSDTPFQYCTPCHNISCRHTLSMCLVNVINQ